MKYFFFKQKRDKVQDPRLKDCTIREFKLKAETMDKAISKHSSKTGKTMDAEENRLIHPHHLTLKDVEELYHIDDYNYALHRDVPELYGKEEKPHPDNV